MSIFILAIAVVLVLGALLHFVLKVLVAYDHCSGGVPLLDGVFPPLFLGIGAPVLFRHCGIAVSGVVVGLVSFVVMIAAYCIAWRLGARRGR